MEPPNILVVDDAFNLRMSFAGIVQHAGYRVETSDVNHALQFLEDKPFDVLVLGVDLPDKGGIKLLPAVHMYYTKVHVIVLSPTDSQWLRNKAVNNGAKDYLVMPLEPEDLIQFIHRAVSRLHV